MEKRLEALQTQHEAAVRGPEDLRDQEKLGKDLYPLLRPIFYLRPYPDTSVLSTLTQTAATGRSLSPNTPQS